MSSANLPNNRTKFWDHSHLPKAQAASTAWIFSRLFGIFRVGRGASRMFPSAHAGGTAALRLLFG